MADQRRLTGYGQVSAARAEASTDHRAVMVNEAEIRVDDVHLYAIPLPSTCFTSGGTITISASLAYDPPVRLTRLDYFANRIGANLYFGATIADVERAYVDSQRRGELDLEDVGATPLTLSSALLDTQPANNVRSRGAHQVGTYHRSSRFDPMRGSDLIVAVRSVNRWDSPTATQSYAIAVAIERDEKHPALYAELEQQLEALTTIQIEGEAEL